MTKKNKALITTVANLKGGVGKTTTVMNLGASLSQQGFKVLLIDSDPQANLTSYLSVSPGSEGFENLNTLDEVYLSKKSFSKEAKNSFIAASTSGMDLIASDSHLSGVEYYLFSRANKESVLREFLEDITPYYDYIFIDTPPSLNLLTLNALTASDRVLIPVQPEFFSLEGIVKIKSLIENVQSQWNPELKILGILPTQVSTRRKLTTEILDVLKGEFSSLLFESVIHENTALAESTGQGKSVISYQKSSKGAQDYLQAAKEFVRRYHSENRP